MGQTTTQPLKKSYVLNLVLALMSMMLVLPFIWMVLTSVKHITEVGDASWVPGAAGWQWSNYLDVFQAIPFDLYMWNSVLVASWVTLLVLVTSSMAAYSFTRIDWPGRDKVFFLYLATMMLPGLVTMIPNFQIMIHLRLVDTLTGLVIPAASTAFGTFLLRQFMLSIPRSYDESASMDGASHWSIYCDIILPLARPGLITLGIFTFISNYHSFFWPLVMLRTQEKYTLPIGLLHFETAAGESTHLLMAAVTMSILPAIVVFLLFQKFLIKGIQLGGVKG